MRRSQLLVALALAVLGAATTGCHRRSETARRQSEQATAEAEEKAQETSLTGAALEAKDASREEGDEALRARGEMVAAFRLEQSDYRGRLQHALDLLDGEVARARHAAEARSGRGSALRARRALLKADLVAVDRSTEQDWATLRAKVERDSRDREARRAAPAADRPRPRRGAMTFPELRHVVEGACPGFLNGLQFELRGSSTHVAILDPVDATKCHEIELEAPV